MSKLLVASICFFVILPYSVLGVSLRDLIHRATEKRSENYAKKRTGKLGECPPWEPFQCPDGDCVPIKYLCDGSPDCADGYDENDKMCTAATRPPVEETANFLRALLQSYGPDFLEKVFGDKGKNKLMAMGGVEDVAVALSQSPTGEDFGAATGLSPAEVKNMKKILKDVAKGKSAGLEPNEASDIKFYAEKLHETGFC